MNSKKILIVLLLIIIFILFLLLYRNYKDNEANVVGAGFESILNKDNILQKLENVQNVLNIDTSNIKNIELSDIFENEVYWNIEFDNNVFIRFDAVNNKIERYIDDNDYTKQISDYMSYEEVKKFIIDKYIKLGYNNEYSLDSIEKSNDKYLWKAIFITKNENIIIEFIPEINRIISINTVK